MNSGPAIRKNFLWVLLGNTTYSFAQWIILIIIIRFAGLEAAGIFGLATALAAPIFALCNLSSRDLLVTEGQATANGADYFQLRCFTSLIAVVVLLIVGTFYSDRPGVFTALLLVALIKAVEAVHDIFEAALQKNESLDAVAKYQMLGGVVACGAVSAGLFMFGTLRDALAALLIARLLTMGLLFGHLRKASREFQNLLSRAWNPAVLWPMARSGLPLGVRRLLVSWNTNAPRYVLEYFHGVSAVGVYTAVSYLMYVGVTLCEALSQASATHLARHWRESVKNFTALLTKLLLFGALVGGSGILVSILFGEPVLDLIYGKNLQGQSQMLTIFMCAAAFMFLYGYLNVAMTVLRLNSIQGILAILALAINITVALLLVPGMAALGAATGTLAGSLVLLSSSSAVVWRSLSKESKARRI